MRGYAAFGLGALGGILVGAGVWYFARRKLDASLATGEAQMAQDLGMGAEQLRAELARGREQLRAQVTAQMQAQVPDVIDQRLALYGITPSMVRNVERVLDYGARAGVL